MEGDTLIAQLALASGLPASWVEDELRRLLAAKGLSTERLTLESLREVMAEFLQDTLLTAKADLASQNG